MKRFSYLESGLKGFGTFFLPSAENKYMGKEEFIKWKEDKHGRSEGLVTRVNFFIRFEKI